MNHFSARESNNGEPIVVQVPGTFVFESSANSDVTTSGLTPVKLKSCHINLNRNGSFISEDNMNKALPSIANRPILAHLIEKEDGSIDFGSHDVEIVTDKDGKQRVHYIEQPIGVIPESHNGHLEYDETMDKTYVVVDGWLFDDYNNGSTELMQEKTSTKVSVELSIFEWSFNAKEKYLELEDFIFSGVTALGEDIGEGMLGSKMTIESFSKENNSIVKYDDLTKQMLESLDKAITLISSFNKDKIKEGGDAQVRLDELLAKYEVTAKDLTFDYEGLPDDELEMRFKEQFEDDDDDGNPTDNEPVDNTLTDTNGCGGGDSKKKKKKYTLDDNGDMEVSFSISHEDIRCSLYSLLSALEENDDEWY